MLKVLTNRGYRSLGHIFGGGGQDVVTQGELLQGGKDCSASPIYPTAKENMSWIVTSTTLGQRIGGASGKFVEQYDIILCIADTSGGTEAQVGTSFIVQQKNITASTLAILRIGTSITDYVTPKVLADQGFTFSATTVAALAGGTTQQLLLTSTADQKALTITSTLQSATGLVNITSTVADVAIRLASITSSMSTAFTTAKVLSQYHVQHTSAVTDVTGATIIGYDDLKTSTALSKASLTSFRSIIAGTVTPTAGTTDLIGFNFVPTATLNAATVNMYGVNIDFTGVTLTSCNDVYGVKIITKAGVDAAIYATDGTRIVRLCWNAVDAINTNGGIVSTFNAGTAPAPAAGTITAKEYGDGKHHITVLTLAAARVDAVAAAALAIGVQIYELPAGVQFYQVTDVRLAFDNDDSSCDADDPVYGIGSVIGSGAVVVLNATATFMDYFTELTSTNCDGTYGAIAGPVAPTAGFATGAIALNAVGAEKSIFLNCAETWTGTTNITVTGTITLVWDTLE